MSFLELRGLSKRYGQVAALRDFDLTIPVGTRTAVVGPSASGKTTLLRLIAGFEQPDTGTIHIDGMLAANPTAAVPPHRRNIGLVMQDGALFPHLTVLENIAFGLPRAAPDREGRALALMDMVELHRSTAVRRPHELSGGQQQRVALARALVRRPRLMLLDEPFSALDAALREHMRMATADILAAAGVTTILVTHDQAEAMSFADQIVVLRGGTLRQAGPPREVYLAPVDRETAEFMGQAIILDATLAGGVATCCLGPVPVAGAREGRATIMLRPEQIALRPCKAPEVGGSTVVGRIASIGYGGPAATVALVLEPGAGKGASQSGPTLTFKTPAPGLPVTGSVVAVSITGAAHVFAGPARSVEAPRAGRRNDANSADLGKCGASA
jgi:iron(III) transport system ATP-binding protein